MMASSGMALERMPRAFLHSSATNSAKPHQTQSPRSSITGLHDTGRQAGRQAGRQTDTHTHTHTRARARAQTDTHTHTHTHTHTD